LCDSYNQSITIDDRLETSGKQVLFPNIVASLTVDERKALMGVIVMKLIELYIARQQV
jgi:hypothetical protein